MKKAAQIIAEVKKASPSKGILREDFDPVAIAGSYAENGAAAISVLTEVDHFQGSIDFLAAVHDLVHSKNIPVLRKDFIFDPYQIFEARAYGADGVLGHRSSFDESGRSRIAADWRGRCRCSI